MTQGELDRLQKSCYFPTRIQRRFTKAGETIVSTRLGEVAFYEATFQARLRLHIQTPLRIILAFYNVCPAQLPPNAWRVWSAHWYCGDTISTPFP